MYEMTEQEKRLNEIMSRASLDIKGNYTIYHNYRRLVEELELEPKKFEVAIRKLSKILKV